MYYTTPITNEGQCLPVLPIAILHVDIVPTGRGA